MLNYSRQRVIEALKVPRTGVLATSGLAGILAGEFPCEGLEQNVYPLVPRTSDHLFNQEHNRCVSLVTANWELKGEAQVLHPDTAGLPLGLLREPGADVGQL